MSTSVVDWCSKQLFDLVHQNNLIYNTCWEDPRLDRVALDIGEREKILVITSAGCNALDYALENPESIYAVDMNPRQNALLELKMAAIRSLDYETFFALFGKGRLPDFPRIYRSHLREQLSPFARQHWDRHQDFFLGKTFYFRGTSGALARMMNHYIDFNRLREVIRASFAATSIEEQRDLYHRYLRPVFWSPGLRWSMSWDATYSLLGVPRSQRQQVEKSYAGGMVKFVEDCVEAVFAKLSLRDNYFWWLYFNGAYSEERCPEYLKRTNFARLKAGLVDKISTYTSTIGDFLRNCEDRISRFVLLDHMDWLSQSSAETLRDEWQGIVDRATPDARVIWRSAGLEVNFVDPLPVRSHGKSTRVGSLLTYHRQLAAELHVTDRVHTYGSFHIADIRQ